MVRAQRLHTINQHREENKKDGGMIIISLSFIPWRTSRRTCEGTAVNLLSPFIMTMMERRSSSSISTHQRGPCQQLKLIEPCKCHQPRNSSQVFNLGDTVRGHVFHRWSGTGSILVLSSMDWIKKAHFPVIKAGATLSPLTLVTRLKIQSQQVPSEKASLYQPTGGVYVLR